VTVALNSISEHTVRLTDQFLVAESLLMEMMMITDDYDDNDDNTYGTTP
jgi:hypothetical protein